MISTALLRCLLPLLATAAPAPVPPARVDPAPVSPAWVAPAPVPPARVDGPKIKLGTLVPKGSSYFKSLQAMSEKWRDLPGGSVALTLYGDGTQGTESDMVRRMRAGTLQAGLLTIVGLGDIDRAVSGLGSLPFTFRSLEEVDHVGEKLQPELEKRLLEKGFVVLFWTDSGWVRFFSKRPVVSPADLRSLKLFAWAGSPHEIEIMKAAGLQPVALETGDILPALQTGMVEAVPLPPFFALAAQIDKHAPHMLDLEYAPLVGACVMTAKAWDAIPEASRESVRSAARDAGREIKARARAESADAVAAMVKRGMTVHTPTSAALGEWHKLHETVDPHVRGKIVPAETFDQVQAILRAYREARGDAR